MAGDGGARGGKVFSCEWVVRGVLQASGLSELMLVRSGALEEWWVVA